MPVNRKQAPEIHSIEQLNLPEPALHFLDNGVPVYEVCMGTQEILKLELVFAAGRTVERKKLVSRATASMIKEGAGDLDAAYIAEQVDFYGANLDFPVNLDYSSIVVHCLVKHFEDLLPMLATLVTQPTFPESELQAFIRKRQYRLQLDLAKSDVRAYRAITELMFGEDHPYGYNSSEQIYAQISRDDVVEHFERTYLAETCQIFISGKTNAHLIHLLNRYLGKQLRRGEVQSERVLPARQQPVRFQEPLPGSVQTSIRIGCPMFRRAHPDYCGTYILNTILGGYFGSRLMTNIREEKGLTYNIFSTLDTLKHNGYFYIGTEVSNEQTDATVKEIYVEMQRLREDLVKEEELGMVRSFLLGNLLTALDGPFNVSDMVRTMITEQVPLSHFDELVSKIKQISPEEIRELAQKYLNPAQMWEVVIGGGKQE
jgi:zinc protease